MVADAATRGHIVRAFVRSSANNILPHENVEIFHGDAFDKDDVALAVEDTDVVISALGSWHTQTKDVQERAAEVIIPEMQVAGVSRIVSITGAEARVMADKITLAGRMSHALFSAVAPKILHDGEAHVRLLEQSSLGWTVVRSPAMTDSNDYQGYAFTSTRPSLVATIYRGSVAKSMVDLAETDDYVGQAPFLRHTK